MLFQVILCLFAAASFNAEVSSYCVNNNREDAESCTRNQTCCKTLQFLIESLSSRDKKHDIDIKIQSDTSLDGILKVEGFTNLVIDGGDSVLWCTSEYSGVYFREVHGLEVSNLGLKNCSMLQNSSTFTSRDNEKVLCAIYVTDSANLTMANIVVSQNRGTGMIIYDTTGKVAILNSTFDRNVVSTSSESAIAGGGGLAIEFTLCNALSSNCSKQKKIENATYFIEDSNFTNNCARETNAYSSSYFNRNTRFSQGLGRGGGMYVGLRGQTIGNSFVIRNCKLINNTASTWGGGMYMALRENATKNHIEITDCDFEHNNCATNGGGGMILALISYDERETVLSTIVKVVSSTFRNNTATKQGGGLLLLSSRENHFIHSDNRIHFSSCSWEHNTALLGSAVDISPSAWDVFGNGHLPTPRFTNCAFIENRVNKVESVISEGVFKITERVGTLLISRVAVELAGQVNFTDNNSNGIFIQSGTLTVLPNTTVNFDGNCATFGGALVLYAFSVLFVSSNSKVMFKNNVAVTKGGALYVDSKDQHEKVSSKSCFIERNYKEVADENLRSATITFDRNRANSKHGNSLYASSLSPCNVSCFLQSGNTQDCPAAMIGLQREDITTSFSNFSLAQNGSNLSLLFPGKEFAYPINATDEMNATISVVYGTSVLNPGESVILRGNASSLSYISDQKTALLNTEDEEQRGTVRLSSKEVTLKVNVTVLECPPGHVKNKSGDCNCDTSYFKGIWKCRKSTKIASIIGGHWIGLCDDGSQCSGNCPVGLCTSRTSTELTKRINESAHFKQICNSNREGKLCGKCTANHSVYYHSNSYRCGDESLCKYGIFFYLLSQILPLTIIFVVIIAFNISFTSGSVNGIILYSQIYDASIVSYYNTELFPTGISMLFKLSKFVYAITNLNYFSIEEMAFCLFKGATTLDVIAWKYITIIYALFLIIVTICVLNTLTCKRLCFWWRPHTIKNAVIHGFTAFLVMSYSQCAKISLQLLTFTTLVRHNFSESETVVFYAGHEAFLSKVHIRYAVPAILFLLTIVVLPPVVLFLYPLCFKLLALCRLSELDIVNRISNSIPMPLFDSFQSCYKDNFRFFSGLYFFYRVIPLLLYAVNSDIVLFYFAVEVFLISAVALHSILQPYKQHMHNIIDTLIFSNLLIINGISLYNYVINNEGKDKLDRVRQTVTVTASVQLILVFLPFIYILVCCVWYLFKVLKKKQRDRDVQTRSDYDTEILLDSVSLPPLRDENELIISHEFHEMK